MRRARTESRSASRSRVRNLIEPWQPSSPLKPFVPAPIVTAGKTIKRPPMTKPESPASTQELLQRAWDLSGVFRNAWAAADVDERQRFFDDVLLGHEVTITEETDFDDVEEND